MNKKLKKRGRPSIAIEVSKEDRVCLERWANGRTVSHQLVQRGKMILLSAEGLSSPEIAARLGMAKWTVAKWRRRFADGGIGCLHDKTRPKTKRKLADQVVEEIIRTTLETTPKGQTRWSTRQLAKKQGVSQSSVSRVWRAFGLKPHRQSTFTLSTDDFFVEKVRDVVGLYMNHPDNAVVLSVDEKSQIQALERTQPVLPMVLNKVNRKTPSYLRHGTTTLFAALDIVTGKVIGKCFAKHRAIEFRKFLNLVDKEVPAELEIHIVVDNYATHSAPPIQCWLKKHPRFHFHFIPTYSSWLNQVERWFGLLSERAIKQGVHRSTKELEQTIREFIDAHNEDPQPFQWHKTADQILASVARHCQYTLQLAD